MEIAALGTDIDQAFAMATDIPSPVPDPMARRLSP